jgi:dihydroneopterin triphosphate diphosphatase
VKRLPRDVSVHLYQRSDDGVRFLMLRRTGERGGCWQGVTGAPLPSESDEEAAAREVREETAYEVDQRLVPLGSYSYALRPDGARRWLEVYGPGVDSISVTAFGADVSGLGEPRLDPGEHDAFEWVDYSVALERLDWPIEADALGGRRRVLTALRSRLET